LVAPVSFLADVRSGSMGVGRLQVAPVSFLADVQSDQQARPRDQRHPRLDRACRIAQHGTRNYPEPVGRSLHDRGDGRGSPLRCIGPRSTGAGARWGGEGRGQPWERPLGGCALCRRHERRWPLFRRRRGLVRGERSPAPAWSKSRPWSESRPRSVTCSVAGTLPLPVPASTRDRAAADDHGTTAYEHRPAPDDHRAAASDHRSAASHHRSAASDHRSTASDHGSAASDHGPAASDDRSAPSDHRIAAADHRRVTEVRRSTCP
jgi:hypothetical protein